MPSRRFGATSGRAASGSSRRSASSWPVGHSAPSGTSGPAASSRRRMRGETFRSQGVNSRTCPHGADVAGGARRRLVEGERETRLGGGEGGFEPGRTGAQDGDVRLGCRTCRRLIVGSSRQKRDAARSRAGRISRQVVHQPVRIVSTNSSGSRSRAHLGGERLVVVGERHELDRRAPSSPAPPGSAYQTCVSPVVGRPADHADVDHVAAGGEAPVPVQPRVGAEEAVAARAGRAGPPGTARARCEAKRNSLIRRGEPWTSSSSRSPTRTRRRFGSVPIQALNSGEQCRSV